MACLLQLGLPPALASDDDLWAVLRHRRVGPMEIVGDQASRPWGE